MIREWICSSRPKTWTPRNTSSATSVPDEHDRSRDDEQEVRVVHEDEAQVSPTVAKRRQLRLADARVELDRELPHVQLLARRANHHLGGELHPDRAEIERREDAPAYGAHAAVRVLDVRPMQGVEESGEDRVADLG